MVLGRDVTWPDQARRKKPVLCRPLHVLGKSLVAPLSCLYGRTPIAKFTLLTRLAFSTSPHLSGRLDVGLDVGLCVWYQGLTSQQIRIASGLPCDGLEPH